MFERNEEGAEYASFICTVCAIGYVDIVLQRPIPVTKLSAIF